jgi:hypothetical protein
LKLADSEVRDHGPGFTLDTAGRLAPDKTSGRGLQLLRSLADLFGTGEGGSLSATTTRTSFTTPLERDQLAVVGGAASGEEAIRFAVLLRP